MDNNEQIIKLLESVCRNQEKIIMILGETSQVLQSKRLNEGSLSGDFDLVVNGYYKTGTNTYGDWCCASCRDKTKKYDGYITVFAQERNLKQHFTTAKNLLSTQGAEFRVSGLLKPNAKTHAKYKTWTLSIKEIKEVFINPADAQGMTTETFKSSVSTFDTSILNSISANQPYPFPTAPSEFNNADAPF